MSVHAETIREDEKLNSSTNFPESCTSGFICFIGILCFIISLYFIKLHDITNEIGGVLSGLALAIPIIVLEIIILKTYRRASTGLNFNSTNSVDLKRVFIKLTGLYATLALVLFFYWLLPVYQDGLYNTYWPFAKYLLAIIVVASIPYFFILDRFLIEPKESYWKTGMIVLGRRKSINHEGLKTHFLGWLIKAFFLPLMFISLCGNIGFIKNIPFQSPFDAGGFSSFFDHALNGLYTIDLVLVTIGYVLTLRIFDSHIRSVEPTFLGWFVALLCYQPFWNSLSGNYFNYDDGIFWTDWLWTKSSVLYVAWGMLILLLVAIYTWASVMFGIRFSNLTHRGILTNGPYRFMRHPAYVSKNISWWLFSVPFISQTGFIDALQHCLLLLLVNVIYFLRAKTEENHLSQDEIYVRYALAVNERGAFRWLYKLLPFLKYHPGKRFV